MSDECKKEVFFCRNNIKRTANYVTIFKGDGYFEVQYSSYGRTNPSKKQISEGVKPERYLINENKFTVKFDDLDNIDNYSVPDAFLFKKMKDFLKSFF